MRTLARLVAAGLLTAGVFGVSAWVCGDLLLRPILGRGDDRWAFAVGLGGAVAAVMATWAVAWAKPDDSSRAGRSGDDGQAAGLPGSRTVTASSHAVAIGGSNFGTVGSTESPSRPEPRP